MRIIYYVAGAILVAGLFFALLAQTGGATRLLGEKGQRITIGSGLELVNNVLNVVFPSQNESVEIQLSQDSGDPMQWNFPAGSQPVATTVKLYVNGVRVQQGGDYTVGGSGSSFFITFTAVEFPSDALVLADFR